MDGTKLTVEELVKGCVALGYEESWAKRMPTAYLRRVVTEGKRKGEGEVPKMPPKVEPKDDRPRVEVTVDDEVAARLADKVAPAVQTLIEPGLLRKAEALSALVTKNVIEQWAKENILVIPAKNGGEPKTENLGFLHEAWQDAWANVEADIPVYVHGPAGSGKTTAAAQLAKAMGASLGRDDYQSHMQSFCAATQLHELIGFIDASGRYHPTEFRKAWEQGGLWLGDEADAAPELTVYLNAALANNVCVFPDKTLKRHPDTRIVTAGNTTGLGATAEYTSRQRQDAATLDRFAFVPWGYDEKLELMAAGVDQTKWVKHVQALRKALKTLGQSAPDIRITPRASIYGATRLRQKPETKFETLEQQFIWKGASDDDIMKVRRAVK
jgi:hypothetical protein